MNKEKLMEVISKSIDEGAAITIHFPQFDQKWNPRKESDMLQLAIMFKEAICTSNIKHKTDQICGSIVVDNGRFRGCFSHSPRGYMIDDVDLSGGADHVSR